MLSLERLRQPAQFGPWLHGIGLNICRRLLRERSRDWWSWEAMLGGTRVEEPLDLRAGPAAEVERTDLVERVRHAVTLLPPAQRAAVMLFYLRGLSHAETAALLQMEVGAVKTRLHKARAALRDELWTLWQEETMAEDTTSGMVEMRVAEVWRMPTDGDKPRQSIVILEDMDGNRRFGIWIGQWEADALAMTIEKVEMPRPMTYVFTARLLDAAGARVSEVHLNRIVQATYYAEVIVDGPAGRQHVDARTSDALNLAVLLNVPIRVAPEVLEQSAGWEAATAERMREAGKVDGSTEEYIEHIRKITLGELTGGAAAIVAEIKAGR
jgi:RNA polymerase sigma factor (sigma-70 family)